MLKNKKFLLTVILPIVISIIIGTLIISLNNDYILKTRAKAIVSEEMEQMTNELNELQKQKKELNYENADLEKQLEDNYILLEEIKVLTTELDEYVESINAANITISELDKSIAEKTQYNNNLSSLDTQKIGVSKSYSNVRLNVPSDIKSGRYRADGNGKILIYTIAGTLEDKQDLSLLDSHSYTFNISSGQYIKIEGTLSLTKLEN